MHWSKEDQMQQGNMGITTDIRKYLGSDSKLRPVLLSGFSLNFRNIFEN